NQPNDNAGIKENLDEGKVGKETVSSQQYVLLPLWSTGSKDPQNIDDDDAFNVKENENEVHVSSSGSDKSKKQDEKAKKDAKGNSPVGSPTRVRDLRAEFKEFSFNSTNRVNAVNAPVNAVRPNPTNNFNTASPFDTAVSPNFRIARKYLCVDPSKYPDDPDMPTLEDIVYLDDKKVVGAEADFTNLETYISVSPTPTTRVYKDYHVNQIIGDLNSAPQTRSMARVVKEQGGVHQINNEDFHTCFMIYQMDIKSSFLYGTIKEEVHVCQPLGFEHPDYPDKVYKMVKALYGLNQAPRACTPIETEKPLLKDPDGEDVDVHIYRSMIGSLMYLTSSRPNILFAVCACARFQVTLKVSYLQAVKRIFRFCCSLNAARSQVNVVEEDVIRQDLYLDDADGVECLPNEDIFQSLHCVSAKRTAWNEFSCSIVSAVICLATVAELEQDKHTQALEILKLNKRVKKLEKKKRSKHSGFKRLRKIGTSHRVESSTDTVMVDMDTELQDRIDQDVSAATKDVSAAEPTMFDDEEVTMTMAQTLIKIKVEKAKLLDKQIAQRFMMRKLKKLQPEKSKKKMIWKELKGMTYNKDRPIFVREYKNFQTLFKPNKDVKEHTKKRVAKETLLQDSFKKLKVVEVSGSDSTQETPSNDPKEISKEDVQNMLEIVQCLNLKLKPYRSKKDYSLSNGVMTLMLSAKLQVEEDSDMARDLVMKIFMEANKPKSRSLDTSSK
nr:hypothetical protein [Tanacetum cinerariifolium]